MGYILRHKSSCRRNAKEMIYDSFIFGEIADLRLFEAHADMDSSPKINKDVKLDKFFRINILVSYPQTCSFMSLLCLGLHIH